MIHIIIATSVGIVSGLILGYYLAKSKFDIELINYKELVAIGRDIEGSMKREISLLKGLVSAYGPIEVIQSDYMQSGIKEALQIIEEHKSQPVAHMYEPDTHTENEH